MITSSDSYNTVDIGKYFAILPLAGNYSVEIYCEQFGGGLVEPGFAYESGVNTRFLTIEELRALIAEHVEESPS